MAEIGSLLGRAVKRARHPGERRRTTPSGAVGRLAAAPRLPAGLTVDLRTELPARRAPDQGVPAGRADGGRRSRSCAPAGAAARGPERRGGPPRGARRAHARPIPRWAASRCTSGCCAGMRSPTSCRRCAAAFDYSQRRGRPCSRRRADHRAVGILDDRYELDALTKFAGQITATGRAGALRRAVDRVWVPWGGRATARC